MAKQQEITKSEQQRKNDEEKLRILAETDAVKGEQLSITETGKVEKENELRQFALGSIEDPDRKYEVYYKGIQRLLKTHLPKGKQNKVARDYIYEEKNTYLSRGKRINKAGIRGADGRMGYLADADEIFSIIMDWIITNGSMVDLYNKIRDLNMSKGYGTRIF
ncbi:MAG: hypothetical protein JWR02_1419 [Mucilaginibacter sp.]|nr:hypothetical protein [Mucilaginibacter sp.]